MNKLSPPTDKRARGYNLLHLRLSYIYLTLTCNIYLTSADKLTLSHIFSVLKLKKQEFSANAKFNQLRSFH